MSATCDRCGTQISATVCGACGATRAYAAPSADTDIAPLPQESYADAGSLRSAGTLQIVLTVLYAIGAVVVYFWGQIRGFEVRFVIAVFVIVLWFVASIYVRKRQRWAWVVSLCLPSFLLLLMGYRIALGYAKPGGFVVSGGLLIWDLVLLIRGRTRVI